MVELHHLGTDRGLHGHLKSDDLFFWNIEDCLSLLDVGCGMNTTVVGRVVPHLELVKVRSMLDHPVEHGLESHLLFSHRNVIVFLDLLLSES